MEPVTVVGLAASIIQLINATQKAIKYLNDVKDAPKERAMLAREATNLLALLTDLRYRVEEAKSTEPWFTGVRSLSSEGGPLTQFQEAMEKLAMKLKPESGLRKLGKTLVWTLDKNDIHQVLSKIERIKTLVGLALQNDQFKLSLAIKDDLTDVKDHMLESKKGITKLEQIHEDHENNEITAWISSLNFSSKQNDFFSRRQEGTGEWLLGDGSFQKWLHADRGILWCPGLPGAGKTILASIVVDYLNQRFERENVAIAYIYCNYKEQEDQTAANLIASLLQQLIRRNSPIPDEIRSLCKRHRKEGTRPTVGEWSKLIQSEVSRLSGLFIIIDALDECPESKGTRDSFLAEIRKLEQSTHLLVTSRHISSIEREFETASRLEIRATDEDVRRYVEGRINSEVRLKRHVKAAPDLESSITSTVVQKAKGMFLLAQLHMDSLAKKHNRRDVRDALDKLPRELDEIYHEALQRVRCQDEEDVHLAERVLYWISYAFTPLTVPQLQHALAVQAGDPDLDEDAFPDEDLLVSVCGGLVTVDQGSNIIRLVHYTTQEYFERIRRTQFPDAQTNIAVVCLTYISFDAFAERYCHTDEEMKSRLHKYPFLRYVGAYWGDHARDAMEQSVKDLTWNFLGRPILVICCNQVLHFVKGLYFEFGYRVPKMSRLSAAAKFGLVEIVQLLLDEGTAVDTKDNEGMTPLHWAAQSGQEAMVQLLLEEGASIAEEDIYERTALHVAVQNGHEAVVQLLLENGAEVDVKGAENEIGYSPLLHEAVRGKNEAIPLLLLEKGADINAKDYRGDTALHQATWIGDEAIVRLLLEKGPDINARDREGDTALYWAAQGGDEAIVRLLLEKGADINVRDRVGDTALHQATRRGDEAIVRLLLGKGAAINARDWNGQTALHITAMWGYKILVRLLLENGADVIEKDENGRSALYLAVAANHEAVVRLFLEHTGEQSSSEKWLATAKLRSAVDSGDKTAIQLLLEKGADINMVYMPAPSLLHLAVTRENGAVVQLLLENGINIAATDGSGRTALHWAAARGVETVVQLLLKNGADITAEDDRKMTALHWAAGGNYEPVVRLLLKKGASVNTVDEYGSSVLMSAIRGHSKGYPYDRTILDGVREFSGKARKRVVELLIENGAETSVKTKHGHTALHYAIQGSWNGSAEVAVVQLLLEKGIDITAKCLGQTALSIAAEQNDEAAVRLLLEHGADVNMRHWFSGRPFGKSWTPLHLAVYRGHEAMVRLLLEKGADINAESEDGEGALAIAAKEAGEVMVEVLLENGIDINTRDGCLGGTALHHAASKGCVDMAQYLLKKGADINAEDKHGRTALDWATDAGHEMMVLFLTPLTST